MNSANNIDEIGMQEEILYFEERKIPWDVHKNISHTSLTISETLTEATWVVVCCKCAGDNAYSKHVKDVSPLVHTCSRKAPVSKPNKTINLTHNNS